MTINVKTVNRYLSNNGKPENQGYLLKDAGSGNFISDWSVSGLSQPTTSQLATIAVTLETEERHERLIAYAKSQESRTTELITLTLSGKSCTFKPTDQFNNRLNNKRQAMIAKNETSTTWVFENGPHTITLNDTEEMGKASDTQWQPYFDTIAPVIGQIQLNVIMTEAQVDAAFDTAYGV